MPAANSGLAKWQGKLTNPMLHLPLRHAAAVVLHSKNENITL